MKKPPTRFGSLGLVIAAVIGLTGLVVLGANVEKIFSPPIAATIKRALTAISIVGFSYTVIVTYWRRWKQTHKD